MKTLRQTLTEYRDRLDAACAALPYPVEKTCFFDIETTGLSPKISSLYLLGAAWRENGAWQLVQWFADDYVSETAILTEFSSFLTRFDAVADYNGSAFDVPYLEKKYNSFHMPSPFTGKEHLDLYRSFPCRKEALRLPDRKLSTVERLAGFRRHDCFSGKDCIRLYTDFMQKKYFRDAEADSLSESLLLHNHDDLIGTILSCSFLAYRSCSPEDPRISRSGPAAVLSCRLASAVPAPLALTLEEPEIQVTFREDRMAAEVPLYEGTLRHFFPDPENYYFLPDEDMAVHKSVGSYVDARHRKKATPATCYIKKTGTFFPLPFAIQTVQPIFKKNLRAALSYIPWKDPAPLIPGEVGAFLAGLREKLLR